MSKTKPFDLSKLLETHDVQLVEGGKVYRLAPINAPTFRKIQELQASEPGPKRVELVYEIAALLVPDAPEAEIEALAEVQITAMMELASDPIGAARRYLDAQVEDRSPNGAGGERTVPSSPLTGSDTPATASPKAPGKRSPRSSSSRSHSPSTLTPS